MISPCQKYIPVRLYNVLDTSTKARLKMLSNPSSDKPFSKWHYDAYQTLWESIRQQEQVFRRVWHQSTSLLLLMSMRIQESNMSSPRGRDICCPQQKARMHPHFFSVQDKLNPSRASAWQFPQKTR